MELKSFYISGLPLTFFGQSLHQGVRSTILTAKLNTDHGNSGVMVVTVIRITRIVRKLLKTEIISKVLVSYNTNH